MPKPQPPTEEAQADFCDVLSRLTNYIQNERMRSYNEAVDMMLDSIRGWMVDKGMMPTQNSVPELLDELTASLRKD